MPNSSKKQKYNQALKSEVNILNRWDDEFCYLASNYKTLDEFKENRVDRLHLYKIDKHLGYTNLLYKADTNTLEICDLNICVEKNWDKGYGSKILKSIIKLAKQIEVVSIIGKLVDRDIQNTGLDKLRYFYKKHGFEIDENNEQDITILLTLK